MSKKTPNIETLDPERFVRLIADILVYRGHSSIRITDGPGDGGRDIHSITKEGKKHLTQCKYHQNNNQTSTSREVSELPMAMTKLGYKNGLFATNAKISPQAKREYLDDYKHLNLDFFDGKFILKIMSTSNILKALWFDGDNLKEMRLSWVFPVILRRHKDDLPLIFDKIEAEEFPPIKDLVNIIQSKYKVLIDIDNTTCSPEPFDPYRPPEPYSQEEGVFPFLFVNEIRVTGIFFSDIKDFVDYLSKAIVKWLGDFLDNFSVRIGKPHLIPLEGTKIGGIVNIDITPQTIIKTELACGNEVDWFGVDSSQYWISESDARVSEAEAIRLYNPTIDICLRYEILCRISSNSKSLKNALREKLLIAWNKSKFAIVPKWEKWNYSVLKEPDDSLEWPWSNKMLCAWFHQELLSPIHSFRNSAHFPQIIDDSNEIERMVKIEEQLVKNKFELIESHRARHMIASVGYDPFEEIDKLRFITGEVVFYPETLPSPINPSSRQFILEFAIRSSKEKDKELITCVSEIITLDNDYSFTERDGDFLIFHINLNNLSISNTPTVQILEEINLLGTQIGSVIETNYGNNNISLCTKEYWKKTYGITFGLSWEKSLLTVKWKNGKPIPNDQLAREMDLE